MKQRDLVKNSKMPDLYLKNMVETMILIRGEMKPNRYRDIKKSMKLQLRKY